MNQRSVMQANDNSVVVNGQSDAFEGVLESTERNSSLRRESCESKNNDSLSLSEGRRLEVEKQSAGDVVTIRGTEGEVELRVTLTDAGPVLHFSAAAVALDAEKVEVSCDNFRVHAKKEVALRGETVTARAMLGDLSLKANDDVRVQGERIRLNC